MDFYIIPRMGLKANYAEVFGKSVNVAAALSWAVTLIFSLILNQYYGMEIFFLGLPGWFVAALTYVLLSRVIQNKTLKEGAAA